MSLSLRCQHSVWGCELECELLMIIFFNLSRLPACACLAIYISHGSQVVHKTSLLIIDAAVTFQRKQWYTSYKKYKTQTPRAQAVM